MELLLVPDEKTAVVVVVVVVKLPGDQWQIHIGSNLTKY